MEKKKNKKKKSLGVIILIIVMHFVVLGLVSCFFGKNKDVNQAEQTDTTMTEVVTKQQ